MNSPRENETSHPLEEVTGEKDVPPEEEGRQADDAGAQDEDAGPGTRDPSAGQE